MASSSSGQQTLDGVVVTRTRGGPEVPAHRRIEVCRLLAAGEVQRAEIARDLGVPRSAITRFAEKHAALIVQMREAIVVETGRAFAGLWIAEKENRLAALEADYELSANGPFAGHYEHIKARTAILRAAAEELGELQQSVTVVPVVHIIQGVDMEALR